MDGSTGAAAVVFVSVVTFSESLLLEVPWLVLMSEMVHACKYASRFRDESLVALVKLSKSVFSAPPLNSEAINTRMMTWMAAKAQHGLRTISPRHCVGAFFATLQP